MKWSNHHISKGKPQPRRAIALKAPGKLPRVLTVAKAQAILMAVPVGSALSAGRLSHSSWGKSLNVEGRRPARLAVRR